MQPKAISITVQNLLASRRAHLESIVDAFVRCDTGRAKKLSKELARINDELAEQGVRPRALPIGLLLERWDEGKVEKAIETACELAA